MDAIPIKEIGARKIGIKSQKRKENEFAIPVELFRNRRLAPLEAISEYLKDVQGLTYHQIAEMLNRDDRTIWTCYKRAKKKAEELLKNQGGEQNS